MSLLRVSLRDESQRKMRKIASRHSLSEMWALLTVKARLRAKHDFRSCDRSDANRCLKRQREKFDYIRDMKWYAIILNSCVRSDWLW